MAFRSGTTLPWIALFALACGGGGRADEGRLRVPPAPPAGAPQPGPAPAVLDPPRQVGPATLTPQSSGTTARLQAVSVVNENVVWASGTGGTFVLTTNGGTTWLTARVAGADSLEFRDVQAIDSKVAYLLSSGPGPRSRIYKTTDGGINWQIQFINREPEAFYDCFAFWDKENGLAFSDNVAGRFPLLRTSDGGQHWEELATAPPASKGEGAFAASGTCVSVHGKKSAWISTGAGENARVLFTPDRGRTWKSWIAPVTQGTSTTGLTSIGFRTPSIGIAAGGDIGTPDGPSSVITTSDGGATWTAGGQPTFAGAVYGVVYVPGTTQTVAVGPKGASWSPDEGRTWQPLDTLSYWSAAFASRKAGWLVGPAGRITKVSF
jgi:photosystem II stability/assembly factor-like uncharacterized protein